MVQTIFIGRFHVLDVPIHVPILVSSLFQKMAGLISLIHRFYVTTICSAAAIRCFRLPLSAARSPSNSRATYESWIGNYGFCYSICITGPNHSVVELLPKSLDRSIFLATTRLKVRQTLDNVVLSKRSLSLSCNYGHAKEMQLDVVRFWRHGSVA